MRRVVTRNTRPMTEAQRVEDWKREKRAGASAKSALDAYRARHVEPDHNVKASWLISVLLAIALVLIGAVLGMSVAHSATVEYGRTCMALAIYSEARSEGYDGQAAVGIVIRNRVRAGMGESICAVVQASGQFKGVEDWPYPRVATEKAAWLLAQRVTEDVITGKYELAPDYCNSALYFRTAGTPLPLNSIKECKIGRHVFFQLSR